MSDKTYGGLTIDQQYVAKQIAEWAYKQGTHDGLKYGPLVTQWGAPVFPPRIRDMIEFLSADLRAQAERVTELETRLEMNAAWQMIDGKMTRVAVEPGSILDGIDCRDATIKLQDEYVAELEERVRVLEEALGWIANPHHSMTIYEARDIARTVCAAGAAEPEGGVNG